MWKKISDEMPPRERDVLIESEDGRRWVGYRCSLATCKEMHYQSDSHEVNYIPSPVCWRHLPHNAELSSSLASRLK